MESEVKRRPRAATWWGRFVLATALLVGIVLMHALGHPGEHADAAHVPGGRTAVAHASGGHMVAAREHVAADADHARAPAPAHGAGVGAVCLAVLGAGVGILLAVRGALVHRRRRTAAPWATRLAHALRAIPPPGAPGSLLTRLSSLRI
ncbi:hypothetical protein ACFYUJ_22430 [Streptomyces sp. NPDC004520]|uniref:hypothetical protein n=1 Tax=Streptomyces sp. NPDC004520 TaxID=3364702 RepID=UPI0036AB120B